MLYQKLSIDNFLCFDHFDIQFAPGVSIIIGRNGAGKTTLIRAMVYSLYFMFTNDRSMGDDFLSAGNPDLCSVHAAPGWKNCIFYMYVCTGRE